MDLSDSSSTNLSIRQMLLPAVGLVVGCIAGFFLFKALASAGLYAIMVPGAAVGYCGGWSLTRRSLVWGAIAGVVGCAATVFAEWSLFPFVADGSLQFFIMHMHELPTMKLVLMGLGGAMAFWFGQGRGR